MAIIYVNLLVLAKMFNACGYFAIIDFSLRWISPIKVQLNNQCKNTIHLFSHLFDLY